MIFDRENYNSIPAIFSNLSFSASKHHLEAEIIFFDRKKLLYATPSSPDKEKISAHQDLGKFPADSRFHLQHVPITPTRSNN